VVTWTVERGLHQGNCHRCVFLVTERIHEQKERYLERYGIVPEFKAGLHGGAVVTAEIGDIKKDIVHSGDTVNTAARVEAQSRSRTWGSGSCAARRKRSASSVSGPACRRGTSTAKRVRCAVSQVPWEDPRTMSAGSAYLSS